MDTITLILWIATIAILVFSLLWFLFGTTALFQHAIDLETTVLYGIFWMPVLILTLALILVLVFKQEWLLSISGAASMQRIVALLLLLVAISTAVYSIHQTPTAGWLNERVEIDVIQTTSDENFEYWVEVINQFQKNAYIRLCIKNTTTGETAKIRLDVQPEDTIITSAYYTYPRRAWFEMNPTSQSDIYILSTTSFYLTIQESFEIDMYTKTSTKMK